MQNTFLIESFLIDEFGLSRRETKLYLCLIQYGASTIIELAEAASMNRTTTHINIDSLTQKGLVTQLKKGRGSRRLIMAEPIEKLDLILKNKKTKIETAEEQLTHIAQELISLKEKSLPNDATEIRRYRGKDEVRLIYEDVLKAKKIRTYANTAEMLEIFPGNVQKFVDVHRKSHDMYIWEIMKDSESARAYVGKMLAERFFCRFVTEGLKLPPTDYFIFDGKVAVIEVSRETINGIVINNNNFYESSKAIHQFVWNYLPDYNK